MGKVSEKCKYPKIFEELTAKGMKRSDFAKMIGVSTGNVSDWASGKSSPTNCKWKAISDALGKPIDELFETQKEPAGNGGPKDEEMIKLLAEWEMLPEEDKEKSKVYFKGMLDMLKKGDSDGTQ